MDEVFAYEQQHLDNTYRKLLRIERQTADELKRVLEDASRDKEDMAESLALDFTSDDMSMETYADLEALNRIIDAHSLSSQISTETLSKTHLLLERPYFAKVSLRFKPGEKPRDVYLGAAGMTDETCRHFIVDWRSPVAETYYNQENGQTSYVAHGRTITCELTLRRQFDIDRNTLNGYFDTTVAIEDPLLLESLQRERNSRLRDITATIQKEQNLVIRHEDVPALLVSGIAGSGKTSVLLQRIAFLLYRLRDALRPDQVHLISPNPVFGAYIAHVLPDMGESNPQTVTWLELLQRLGLESRGSCRDATVLDEIDRAVSSLALEQGDFRDLTIDGERVISANQVRSAVDKYPRVPAGSRLAGLVEEELLERLEQRIKRLSKSEDVHDAVSELELDEQIRIFGRLAQPDNEQEACALSQQYLRDRYQPVLYEIERADWLRVDRVGKRLLGRENLSAEEWLYLKMAITGYGDRDARFVMVDEVQDYTVAQLAVLSRYFKNAHFLLLGDESQAIREGTATFDEIRELFSIQKGSVHECELMTSYRSSPEITNLFCGFLPETQRVKTSSVQRPGVEPTVMECLDDEEYLAALRAAIRAYASEPGLTAVIVQDKRRAKWLAKALGADAPLLVDEHGSLPDSGVFILTLELAKGLEFDHVIIPDAQASVFDERDVSRHRLYTAISRATKKVSILSQGKTTTLLP